MDNVLLKLDKPQQFILSGKLNFETVPKMGDACKQLFASPGAVTVDLEKIFYSDSSGLALLAEWTRQARKHNTTLRYINIPLQMLAIADVTGLKDVLFN